MASKDYRAKTSPQASFARKRRGAGMGPAASTDELAIALVLDGVDRKTAAANCGMDRQTPAGLGPTVTMRRACRDLFNRRPPDPPCLLSAAQKEELAEMVRAGPDPETDGVVRRRRIDLKPKIEERFGVTMHERVNCWQTIGKPGLSASVGAGAASEIRPGCIRRLLKKLSPQLR